jgi:hypothetical protein
MYTYNEILDHIEKDKDDTEMILSNCTSSNVSLHIKVHCAHLIKNTKDHGTMS